MNALPCPTCGYDIRPDIERMKRLATLQSENSSTHWRVVGIECNACDEFFDYDPGISHDGVGPERLVPVEVGA